MIDQKTVMELADKAEISRKESNIGTITFTCGVSRLRELIELSMQLGAEQLKAKVKIAVDDLRKVPFIEQPPTADTQINDVVTMLDEILKDNHEQ